jgi:hypothetical protein
MRRGIVSSILNIYESRSIDVTQQGTSMHDTDLMRLVIVIRISIFKKKDTLQDEARHWSFASIMRILCAWISCASLEAAQLHQEQSYCAAWLLNSRDALMLCINSTPMMQSINSSSAAFDAGLGQKEDDSLPFSYFMLFKGVSVLAALKGRFSANGTFSCSRIIGLNQFQPNLKVHTIFFSQRSWKDGGPWVSAKMSFPDQNVRQRTHFVRRAP